MADSFLISRIRAASGTRTALVEVEWSPAPLKPWEDAWVAPVPENESLSEHAFWVNVSTSISGLLQTSCA